MNNLEKISVFSNLVGLICASIAKLTDSEHALDWFILGASTAALAAWAIKVVRK